MTFRKIGEVTVQTRVLDTSFLSFVSIGFKMDCLKASWTGKEGCIFSKLPTGGKGHTGQKSDPDRDEENLLLILLEINFWIPGMILLDNFKL